MGKVGAPISQVLHITMSFVAFSCTMGNWWGNPCISHMMKYIIGWESNGKKALILWEKYEYQFPRFTPYEGFCCIFPYYEKLDGNRMGKKAPILWEKYDYRFPRLPHTMGFVAFSRTVGNLWGNPCTSHMLISVNFFLCYLASEKARYQPFGTYARFAEKHFKSSDTHTYACVSGGKKC